MKKVKGVTVRIHPAFFNKVFEPQRLRFQKRLKIPISQMKLTELLARSQIKIIPPKINRKFIPKTRK